MYLSGIVVTLNDVAGLYAFDAEFAIPIIRWRWRRRCVNSCVLKNCNGYLSIKIKGHGIHIYKISHCWFAPCAFWCAISCWCPNFWCFVDEVTSCGRIHFQKQPATQLADGVLLSSNNPSTLGAKDLHSKRLEWLPSQDIGFHLFHQLNKNSLCCTTLHC